MHWIGIAVIVLVVAFMVYRMVPAKGVKSMSAGEVKDFMVANKSTAQFIDVREPSEFRSGHVKGFKNVPLSQLGSRLDELKRDRPVILMCRSGSRSQQAARTLVKHGYTDVRNASGGIMAWNRNK